MSIVSPQIACSARDSSLGWAEKVARNAAIPVAIEWAAAPETPLAGLSRKEADRTQALPLFQATTLTFARKLGGPSEQISFQLSYSPLGQPLATWEGMESRQFEPQVSFTHDGGTQVCTMAGSAGLMGLGADIVHLPRLAGKSESYLTRFAKHFMNEEELIALRDHDGGESLPMAHRVAAHFSLMEATSKALGTGLRMGIGMGGPASVSKRSISALSICEPVRIVLSGDALERANYLGASHVEGLWGAEGAFLLSLALLWR